MDILKASNKNKVVNVLDDEEVATRVAYIKQRNGL
jgi:hypothetical protein